MANISKATKLKSIGLFAHYERKDGVKFSNQDIDKSRSHLNYNLAPIQNISQNEILKKRLSEVKVLKRDNVNVMCSWVITLPETIEKDSLEEKKFFEKSYEFLKEEYGEKNIISSYVHKDETTPHMHFCFVPIVIDKKKKIEKVSAKELITRPYLNKFHVRLSDYMTNIFGKDIGVLNGATTNGNRTVLEMKNEQLEKELNKHLNEIEFKIQKRKNELSKIESEINSKENRLNEINEVIKNIIESSIDNNSREKLYRYLLMETSISKKDLVNSFKSGETNAIKIGQDNIGILNNKDEIYFWEFEKNKKPTTKIPNKILERILTEFTNSNYKSYDYELER